MYKDLCITLSLVLLVGSMSVVSAQAQKWEFSQVNRIRVDGLSGDVVVRPATGRTVRVVLVADVRPARRFRPRVDQDGAALYIEEQWGRGRSEGHVEWTIYLPQGARAPELTIHTSSGGVDGEEVTLRIDFRTSSGDIRLTNVELLGRSEFHTSSGDITLRDMTVPRGCRFDTASGEIQLVDIAIEDGCAFSTASGRVSCHACRGFLHLTSASGDVDVRDSEITGWAELSSASGDVSVYLEQLPNRMSASSASGDVLLDVQDFGNDFELVLIKREDRGRFSSPFRYTYQGMFRDGAHVYERRVVKRGSGGPEIELRTASGSVRVRT